MSGSAKTPVVVVLGMHRSGTSVGMSVLSSLGVDCGEDLIPAGRSNLAGFWEHAEIVAVQEKLLAAMDRIWHGTNGTFPLPDGWRDTAAAKEAQGALTDILRREMAAHPGKVWGFKDPRTMRLWPLWLDVFEALDVEPIPVVMVRHPDAVVRSLAKHNGLSPSRARLVWLQHNVEAMRHVGDRVRAVVEYDRLVNDPAGEVDRIADALRDVVTITDDARGAAKARISTDLRSHRAAAAPPGNALAAEVFDALRSGDPSAMAAVVARYDAAEEMFDSWRSERGNVLSDWILRFLVSRKNG
ncbi:MAG: sulfotransferase [Pseudomonadota bacterium]